MAIPRGIPSTAPAGTPVGRRTFLGLIATTTLGLAGCATAAPTTPSHEATTATPSPSAAPTDRPSGLVWSDEFDGADGTKVSASKWYAMDLGDGWGNQELESYTPRPENVSHDGAGSLRIRAIREDYRDPEGNETTYTSGRIESVEAFRYGHIEARISVPAGAGLWPAFWMIGRYDDQVQWPQTGEIDIMEYTDDDPRVQANVHADTTDTSVWQLAGSKPVEPGFARQWHVYSVDWTTDSLSFAVDGTVYHQVNRSQLTASEVWEFDRPQYIIVNLAVGGTYPRSPNDPTAFPATMLVDYIRVFDSEVHPRLVAP